MMLTETPGHIYFCVKLEFILYNFIIGPKAVIKTHSETSLHPTCFLKFVKFYTFKKKIFKLCHYTPLARE